MFNSSQTRQVFTADSPPQSKRVLFCRRVLVWCTLRGWRTCCVCPQAAAASPQGARHLPCCDKHAFSGRDKSGKKDSAFDAFSARVWRRKGGHFVWMCFLREEMERQRYSIRMSFVVEDRKMEGICTNVWLLWPKIKTEKQTKEKSSGETNNSSWKSTQMNIMTKLADRAQETEHLWLKILR